MPQKTTTEEGFLLAFKERLGLAGQLFKIGWGGKRPFRDAISALTGRGTVWGRKWRPHFFYETTTPGGKAHFFEALLRVHGGTNAVEEHVKRQHGESDWKKGGNIKSELWRYEPVEKAIEGEIRDRLFKEVEKRFRQDVEELSKSSVQKDRIGEIVGSFATKQGYRDVDIAAKTLLAEIEKVSDVFSALGNEAKALGEEVEKAKQNFKETGQQQYEESAMFLDNMRNAIAQISTRYIYLQVNKGRLNEWLKSRVA